MLGLIRNKEQKKTATPLYIDGEILFEMLLRFCSSISKFVIQMDKWANDQNMEYILRKEWQNWPEKTIQSWLALEKHSFNVCFAWKWKALGETSQW